MFLFVLTGNKYDDDDDDELQPLNYNNFKSASQCYDFNVGLSSLLVTVHICNFYAFILNNCIHQTSGRNSKHYIMN